MHKCQRNSARARFWEHESNFIRINRIKICAFKLISGSQIMNI